MRTKTLVWATLLVFTFTLAGYHAFAGDPQGRDFEEVPQHSARAPVPQETSTVSFPDACYQDLEKTDYVRKELVLIDPDEGWLEALANSTWVGGYWVEAYQNGAGNVIVIGQAERSVNVSPDTLYSHNLVRPIRTPDGCGEGAFQKYPKNKERFESRFGGAGYFHYTGDDYRLWLRRMIVEDQVGVETVEYFLSGEATFIDDETGKPRQNKLTVKAVDEKTVEALERVYRKLNPSTPDLISQR